MLSLFSSAWFVEYFKDIVLVTLFLIGFGIWARSRRIEIRASRDRR